MEKTTIDNGSATVRIVAPTEITADEYRTLVEIARHTKALLRRSYGDEKEPRAILTQLCDRLALIQGREWP